jgi:hypothetical protein
MVLLQSLATTPCPHSSKCNSVFNTLKCRMVDLSKKQLRFKSKLDYSGAHYLTYGLPRPLKIFVLHL